MSSTRLLDWKLRLQRLTLFLRTLFKSKMAVAGLAILLLYTTTAIAAPLVTPYNPQLDIVAAANSPPSWITYLSEGSGLSQNLDLESKPGFPDATSLQGWNTEGDTSRLAVTWADDPVKSFRAPGSVKITLDRTGGLSGSFTFTFKKVFFYPYDGPPGRFTAGVAILTPTASLQEPVKARVFIERLAAGTEASSVRYLTNETPVPCPATGGPFASWDPYPFTANRWNIPAEEIDSNSERLKCALGTEAAPQKLLFSASASYAYGVEITLTSVPGSTQSLEIYLDDLSLRLFGNAWGFLGTEATGKDLFSQLVYGTRVSLLVGLLSAFIGIALGLVVGLMAGYMGKIVDEVLMRFTDMLLVIPTLPLLIVLIAVLGSRLGASVLPVLIIVIGFLGWMGFARVVRAQVLSIKERPFVEAAKAAGAGNRHITLHHIVPNIVGLIYVNLALTVPGAILSEAALSFLGLGDSTVVSWGKMLNEVLTHQAYTSWWWVIPPGLSIALVSLSFVLIGYSLDELFNPKLRQRR